MEDRCELNTIYSSGQPSLADLQMPAGKGACNSNMAEPACRGSNTLSISMPTHLAAEQLTSKWRQAQGSFVAAQLPQGRNVGAVDMLCGKLQLGCHTRNQGGKLLLDPWLLHPAPIKVGSVRITCHKAHAPLTNSSRSAWKLCLQLLHIDAC